jgi:uncharacterized protein (TIGR02246 family)
MWRRRGFGSRRARQIMLLVFAGLSSLARPVGCEEIALLTSVGFAVAPPQSVEQSERIAPIPPDARRTIDAANSAWVGAMQREDGDEIAAPYADDGVFVTATGETVRGRNAIAQMMRDRFSQMGKVVGGRLTQDGLVRQGSSIYEWGHAVLDVTGRDGATRQSAGRYLTVWQHKPGGRWEIVRNLSLPE